MYVYVYKEQRNEEEKKNQRTFILKRGEHFQYSGIGSIMYLCVQNSFFVCIFRWSLIKKNRTYSITKQTQKKNTHTL